MLPTMQIGPLALQVPGLLVLLGVWLGLNLAEKYSHRHAIDASALNNLVFMGLITGLLGARLAYVVRYSAAFTQNPASFFSLNPGLLDPLGGMAVGMIAALIYGQRKGLGLLPTLDALTPLLSVMALAIGLAHLASGDAYGAPTTLPWGINLWGANRHPSQVYEILGAGLILAAFWPGRSWHLAWKPGIYFLAFISASAGMMIFLQAFRGDSRLLTDGLRVDQLIAWCILALCLLGIGWIVRQPAIGKAPSPEQRHE